ncbi:TonB-dependent receptor [Congregibacter litoralis]|uniref:Outer membrane receptor protein, mostly Fe transport n=1 Tax=Congregibacter litoralis KT71 TaxID=314285 RepID=A4AC05_9GAMM|nr:TonB-dependent receptor [Congregibacter litoralis]EAQ96455.1 Outer membrane receptor protein, mostly Fe transport [Congregibacter litoralis KT71]
MPHKTTARKPLFAATTVASLLLSAAASPLVSAQSEEPSFALEEVLVTARRRAENLQDVPIAVTSLSGDALRLAGSQDITELAQSVPSVTLEPSRATNTTLTAFIRGVGQQDPLAGFEQGVALYLDDVYMARPQGALLDIYDVERIEVLRGPQGTLYGRNAVGGAIKYVTRRLSDEFEASVRASYGTYNQADLVGTVSVPVTDTFRVGATVASFNRDGFGDNLFTGGEQYDKDIFGYRLSAEWEPNENFLIRLAYDNTDDQSSAVAGWRPYPGAISGTPSPSDVFDTNAGASVLPTTAGINGNNQVEAEGWSASVDWNLSDTITLRSITAGREDFTESVIDFDSLASPDFDAPVIYDNEQFSQEFQLLWNTDRWNLVLGYYYLDAEAANDFDVVLGLLAPGGLTAYTGGVVETDSWSVFGDLTYELTDRWSLSVGGRYTEDERSADIFRGTYLGTGSPFFGNDSAILLAATSDYEAERTYYDFSPRANLSYALTDDIKIYGGYSQGWKAGSFDPRGANFATPAVEQGFDPEELDSWEVGLKSTWWDGRAITNVALFYSDYQDMQIPGSVGVDSDGDGVNDSFVGTVTNAGQSEISGIEIEGNLLLTENFSMQFSASFLDASFKEYLVGDIDVSDDRDIQNTPEEMVFIGLNYNTDLAGGNLLINTNYSYKGDVQQFEIASEDIDQEAYGLLNASIVWTSGDDHWLVGLYGKNLTDEEYRTAGYCFGTSGCPSSLGLENNTTVFFGPPTTGYVTVEYRFQ